MDLQNALSQMEEHSEIETVSPLQALKNLNESVTEALLACIKDLPEQAGQHLLSALPQLMLAMSVLGVDPIQTPPHPIRQDPETRRLIHIDGNRVEVRVDDEIRGSWTIWSVADLKEVCRLAEEFDCSLVYSFIGSLAPTKSELFMAKLRASSGLESLTDQTA